MIDRFEQFAGYISGIFRQIQKLEREELEKWGLKGAFAQYLIVMTHYPEGITAAQLSEVCDKDKAAVSRVIAELAEKGMVKRVGDKGTLYRAPIALTEEGLRAAAFVAERATIAVAKANEGLSEEHRRIMYSSLGIIFSNLEKVCAEGIPEKE